MKVGLMLFHTMPTLRANPTIHVDPILLKYLGKSAFQEFLLWPKHTSYASPLQRGGKNLYP
jgi:hypothetical protein